jgi:hypothetical protein
MEKDMTETDKADSTKPSPELIAFRDLVSQEAGAYAAFNAAEQARDAEATAKSETVIDVLGKRVGELAKRMHSRPVQSWADVIERAEIARFWQEKRPDGSLAGLGSKYGGDRANARLIEAMLALAPR